MNATRIRRAGVLGVAAALALALGVPAVSAAADPPSAVGRYRLTTTTVKSQLVINADHTFQLVNFGDSGTWEQLGTVIALGIYSGNDSGCVLMGVLNTAGISGKARPGNFSCSASAVFPMYAKRLPTKPGAAVAPRAGASLRAELGRTAAPTATTLDATGSYTATQNGSPTSFLVAADHTVTWPDLGDTGSWAAFNNVSAFIVTSFTADQGCFEVGITHATAINSIKLPGPRVCPGDVESTWFACRLVA